MEITPFLPLIDAKIDFDLLECSLEGPDINIVEDFELQAIVPEPVSVIELVGITNL